MLITSPRHLGIGRLHDTSHSHGELDERVNAGWPAFEEALTKNGVEYAEYMYADANHGFHNDTTPRFDEEAAALAWERTIGHFNNHLKTDTPGT